MPRSTIRPDTIWIRKKENTSDGLLLIARVRWDIQEEQVPDPQTGESHTEYVYEEQELELRPLALKFSQPGSVETQLADWLDRNTEKILNAAYQKKARETGELPEQKYPGNIELALEKIAELADMSYQELEQYIETNVTTLASAKEYLKKVSRVVLGIIKVIDYKEDML